MTVYTVLVPGDEAAWEAAPPEARDAVYAEHERFNAELARRGHTILCGAELTHSREARTLRGADGGVVVTEGPYAEVAEQLTGLYLVDSADADDLLEVCALLAGDGGAVEVRACVDVMRPEHRGAGVSA